MSIPTHRSPGRPPFACAGTLRPEESRVLRESIRTLTGVVLDESKHYLVEARLSPIVRRHGFPSLSALSDALRKAGSSALHQEVIDAITTHETLFFRDQAHFDVLRSVVLPELIERRSVQRRLSIWSAACSSGQEAYSLAILLHGLPLAGWRLDVLGTDVSQEMVQRTRQGVFSPVEVNRGLCAQQLARHFHRSGADWQARDHLRRMVRSQQFDLRRPMDSLGPFDLVLCRNVLIYFDVATKRSILRGIRGTLAPDGCLVLGGAETLVPDDGLFERESVLGVPLYRPPRSRR